jgi:hypothetical protein
MHKPPRLVELLDTMMIGSVYLHVDLYRIPDIASL